jgi:hypothetical protein
MWQYFASRPPAAFSFAFYPRVNRASLPAVRTGPMNTGQSRLQTTLRSDALFSALLLGVFVVLGAIGLNHHAMWRDETDPWLIARASRSLRELYSQARPTGHFMLWYVLVWFFTRFTQNCEALQWFHLALATGSLWLVVRFGPFIRAQKVLYCFGYFTLFEYCLVCREYVCVVLLIFSLCVLYDRRRDSVVLQAAVLFLLSNIDVFATFIAFAFVAARALEQIHLGRMGEWWPARKWALIVSGLILGTALLVNGLQLGTLTEGRPSTGWRHPVTASDLARALSNVWRGYVPIALPFPHYSDVWRGSAIDPMTSHPMKKYLWGSNFLLDHESEDLTTGMMLSLGLLAASVWTLRRSRMAVMWYSFGTGLMLLFQSMIWGGALRHHGLYFILYLACVWVGSAPRTHQKSQPAAATVPAGWEELFLPSLLALQVVAGVYAWTILYGAPFSGSKAAADFIRQHGYANLPIVGSKEANVSPVTAYLNRPIYYPDSARYGTYHRESDIRPELTIQEVTRQVFQLAQKEHTDALVLLTGRIPDMGDEPFTSSWLHPDGGVSPLSETPMGSHLKISHLAEFRATVDELYCLYLVRQP